MEWISGMTSGTVPPTAAVAAGRESLAAQPAREEGSGHLLRPAMDEYVPEEKQEPYGRYWPGRDEDGRPKLYFDDPEGASSPEPPGKASGLPEQSKRAERAAGKKSETCTGDTGKVDREIEKLKRRQAELEQRLCTEADEAKRKALEKELSQIERELHQKDNDAYRRQHTTFS